MDIYEFLTACSQSDEIEFSVFDCNSERVWKFESATELQCSKFADYEVMSFDVWYDKKEEVIKMEINIEYEEII